MRNRRKPYTIPESAERGSAERREDKCWRCWHGTPKTYVIGEDRRAHPTEYDCKPGECKFLTTTKVKKGDFFYIKKPPNKGLVKINV